MCRTRPSPVASVVAPGLVSRMRAHGRRLASTAFVVVLGVTGIAGAALSPALAKALDESRYVYVATERKDGSFGAPAEIWFMHHDGAVFVASPTTTWRVKRIQKGRTKARIAIGAKDGPSFMATGAIVKDPALYDRLFTALAAKYPDRWPGYEERFRAGLREGSRVLIRYRPAT